MTGLRDIVRAAPPGPEQLAQHVAWLRARDRLCAPARLAPKATIVVRRYVRPTVILGPSAAMALSVAPEAPPLFDDSNIALLRLRPERLLAAAPRTARDIAADVAAKHGIPLRTLLSIRRDKVIVTARQEAMWRIATETSLSTTQIGRLFDRDHTTVMHSIKRHEERLGSDATRARGKE